MKKVHLKWPLLFLSCSSIINIFSISGIDGLKETFTYQELVKSNLNNYFYILHSYFDLERQQNLSYICCFMLYQHYKLNIH